MVLSCSDTLKHRDTHVSEQSGTRHLPRKFSLVGIAEFIKKHSSLIYFFDILRRNISPPNEAYKSVSIMYKSEMAAADGAGCAKPAAVKNIM